MLEIAAKFERKQLGDRAKTCSCGPFKGVFKRLEVCIVYLTKHLSLVRHVQNSTSRQLKVAELRFFFKAAGE